MIFRALFRFSSQKPKLYVFGGQGTHEKGMLAPFLKNEKARKVVIQMSQQLDIDFQQIGTTDKQNKINQTEITQPLLVLTHYLMFKYEKNIDIEKEDLMIGHSLGEYSALTLAGSLKLKDCLKVVRKRGQLMKESTKQPHGMLIIKYKSEQEKGLLEKIKQSKLEIACYNTPKNIIVAGLLEGLNLLKSDLRSQKISSILLPVSTAFHCRMLQKMRQPFQKVLQQSDISDPFCKIIRNYDCSVYQNRDDIIQGLTEQLTSPVLFYQSVQKTPEEIECIEIGVKNHMTKFVEETRKD